MEQGDAQPSELGELKTVVKEFIDRLQTIDNEIETLKGDRKELIEEFSDRIDMRELQAAMKVVKIKTAVRHKDAFDNLLEVLENHDGEG